MVIVTPPEPSNERGDQKDRSEWPLFRKLDELTEEVEDPGRWAMLRDLLVFQGKLALDALRDLALSPISLIAGILGIIRNPDAPGRYFYSLMKMGRRSDVWINLFGASKTAGLEDPHPQASSVDSLVERLEGLVVSQYEEGGLTAQAKEAIDDALEKFHETARREGEKFRD